MTTLLSDNFETKLGTIQTWVESEKNIEQYQQDKFKVATIGHEICLVPFDLKQIWFPETMEYESAKGWRWFIEKTNNEKEKLTIFCKLINPSTDTEFDSSSGEHLDAIEIENRTYHLHIGTEDGERLKYRAEQNEWMPKRFKGDIGFHKSFTEYVDFGFKTIIPTMDNGEKIYFHFIVATNSIEASKDYPYERNISTWFAVDKSKRW